MTERLALLSEQETSDWLGVPVNTLRDWRAKRKHLPFIALSERKVRYSVKSVNEYLEALEAQSLAGE